MVSKILAVKSNFSEEQDYIQRYIEFTLAKAKIYDHEIYEVSNKLKKHGLPPFPTKENWKLDQRSYFSRQPEELSLLMANINKKLDEKIMDGEREFANLKKPKGIKDVDGRSLEGEFIQYAIDILGSDVTDATLEIVKAEMEELIKKSESELLDFPRYSDEDLVSFVISSAVYIIQRNKLGEMKYLKDKLHEIELAIRITNPGTEVNIYRQGFILLMTAFDAAIFDLVKLAMVGDFFNLIGIFGKGSKIALESMERYSSYENFKEELIEEQLKGRYLRDLLCALNNLNVNCLDETGEYEFVHLLELVMRRNIHVHNRGIVDERYLGRTKEGKSHPNIYNLTLGSTANIEKEYWDLSNKLCIDCVSKVSDWALTICDDSL